MQSSYASTRHRRYVPCGWLCLHTQRQRTNCCAIFSSFIAQTYYRLHRWSPKQHTRPPPDLLASNCETGSTQSLLLQSTTRVVHPNKTREQQAKSPAKTSTRLACGTTSDTRSTKCTTPTQRQRRTRSGSTSSPLVVRRASVGERESSSQRDAQHGSKHACRHILVACPASRQSQDCRCIPAGGRRYSAGDIDGRLHGIDAVVVAAVVPWRVSSSLVSRRSFGDGGPESVKYSICGYPRFIRE